MSIGIYVRVSSAGQTIDSQRREIERWLIGQGLAAQDREDHDHEQSGPAGPEWYIDYAASGATIERPAFARLQSAIFAGEVRTVIVWRLDRLSRSLRDGLNLLADWCERGVRVVSITQQLDLSGTVGRMVAVLLLGVAEMERETLRERQAAGIAVAKGRGRYRGRQPGTTKRRPTRALELRRQGLRDGEIATALGVSRRTVQRYLSTSDH